jgi:hypothetical protein
MEPSRNGLLRLRLRIVFPCVSVAFSAPISKRGILLARLPVRHENMCSSCLLLLLLRPCNRGSYLQDHHGRDNGYTLRSIVGREGRHSLSLSFRLSLGG